MEELNTMLADLARDGALESTGVFTLSLQQAEEKLAAYRLANPGLFVLNLVAAAVSSGATYFSVEAFENHTSFRFDPKAPYEERHLHQIFSYILDPAAPAHLREMALALHGARALPESPATSLRVATGQSALLLAVTADDVDVDVAAGQEASPGVTFRLTYQSAGAWTTLFARRQDKSQDVLGHLFHFCRYAPLRITSNGQCKGSAVDFGAERYKAVFAWRHVEGQQGLQVSSAPGHYSRPAGSDLKTSTMVIGLAPLKVAQANGLVLVSRGVAFRRPAQTLGFPLACAVVTADHLEKNLSQSDLVDGPEYDKLIEAVRAEVRDLVLAVCDQPPPWPSVVVADAFAAALDLHFSVDQAPPAVETFRRLRAIEVSCRDADAQSEQMSYWRALLVRDSRQGEAFRQELITAVTRQATRRLVHAQWKEAALYLTDLYELKGSVPDPLLAAVMVLTNQSARAQNLLSMASPRGTSPRLEYLLGWGEELDGDRPIVGFLRFQRAVDTEQLDTADALADALEGSQGTAFLYLWLGWYQLYRQRHQRTAELWERALSLVPVEERERWSNILYPEIAGKLSFIEQVRWQARRSLEGIQFSLGSSKKGAFEAGQTTHPARWAKNVWGHRMAGQREAARELFVKGYLMAMINARQLCLEAVDSSEISLAPFRA
jgi:uncharacterized protein (DUF2237 family)